MVSDQFLEILSRLLHSQHKDNSLLSPISSLEKIVEFKRGIMRLVGEIFVHCPRIEIPKVCSGHNV